MKVIHIRRLLESDTLYLPEVKPLIGRTVQILISEEAGASVVTEKDWESFFAAAGPDLVDPELYRQYRAFDQGHNSPPQL
jgi:hypothetical protein